MSIHHLSKYMCEVCLMGTHLTSIWLLLEQGVRSRHCAIRMIFSQWTMDSSSSILFFIDFYIIHCKWVKKRKWSWGKRRLALFFPLSVASIFYCLIVLPHSVSLAGPGSHHTHDDLTRRFLHSFFLGFFMRSYQVG